MSEIKTKVPSFNFLPPTGIDSNKQLETNSGGKSELQSFPLYEKLAEKVKNGLVDSTTMQKLSSDISSLTLEHHYQIGLIIYHHSKINKPNNSFKLIPYSGTILPGGKGVIFQMTQIPPFLQLIISCYIKESVI